MAIRGLLAGLAVVLVGVPGLVPAAYADVGPSSFTNAAATAVGRTPSGVTVTVRKKMIGKTRVASAEVLPANPAADDDEYLAPANAKTAAGFIDLYEDFAARPGGWSDVATLTFTFSRPVRDPSLHVFGTGGSSGASTANRDDFWPAIDMVSGLPVKPAFAKTAGFPGYRVSAGTIEPERVYSVRSTTCGVVYTCGTVKVAGTVTEFTIKLRARDVRYGAGGTNPQVWGSFKLSLTEDVSDAPVSYGAAAHAIGDSFLGRSVSADHGAAVGTRVRGLPAGTDDDDAVTGSPARVASCDLTYSLVVPVRSQSPAYVAGWIDFNHNGRFDADERAVTRVPDGALAATLKWTVTQTPRTGPAWMRLRLVTSAGATASPTGWADGGEVEDHQIELVEGTVGADTAESGAWRAEAATN